MAQKAREKVHISFMELPGDTLTPVSIFQKISGERKFLLESSLWQTDAGRYSYIGAEPSFELISKGTKNRLVKADGKESLIEGEPLKILGDLLPQIETNTVIPPFFGGAAGYAGYDLIRFYEEIGPEYGDELDMPDSHFMFFEEVIVYDHHEQKVYVTGIPLDGAEMVEGLAQRHEKRKKELLEPTQAVSPAPFEIGTFKESITKNDYMEKVDEIKKHIEEGDIFQAVLSQRLSAIFDGDCFSCYRKLRTLNPSPYMFYFEFGEYTVMGVSPESLVRTSGRTVFANPIAGTRPRGETVLTDNALEIELKQDEKELAEHRMLVDLGRNDLGRICEYNSIQISKYLEIEKYRYVMHLVSELKGTLGEEKFSLDALAACLPAGTVTGAPKIKAMQIINDQEKQNRGLYSGAIGYISASGDIDFALAIRTLIIKGGIAYIQAGAGIVHDSKPENEYEETMNKMKAFREGLA
ncbi:anthranilate synthase component I [Bacillus sp. B-jedd]|uniref:anthranilate synthase component I n=1 Tax=Bacillus sp. B-jedd TaxID=1476857 RepID=UPI0005155F6E|nr:anthranilate synthase component I [Bacillus sp. B-jedd]CEG27503.1 anthranilate synthase component I [Bacillus sp. B-jedd]